jgi:hypothetical protein
MFPRIITDPADADDPFLKLVWEEAHKRQRIHDPYEYREREDVHMEAGLSDRPIQGVTVTRGDTPDKLEKEINELKEVLAEHALDDNRAYWAEGKTPEETAEINKRMDAHNAELQKFVDTPLEEIYFVFCDDCQALNPPVVSKPKLAVRSDRPDDDWGNIYDEWNVLANWCPDDPDFTAVWNRRKVSFKDAVARIQAMTIAPPPERVVYKVNPAYAGFIREMEKGLVPIEDEDTAPHKLVVTQQRLRYRIDYRYGLLASMKLMELIGGSNPPQVQADGYHLKFEQSQYDRDWGQWTKYFAEKGMKVEGNKAYLDLSNDPDFATAPQKIYSVSVGYYDSHASGW